MTSPNAIEVKVVFDASSRGKRGAVRLTPHSRTEGTRSWRVLGAMHLLVAAALYYCIWWKIDPFLYMTLMLKTPVDVDLGAAAGMFGLSGAATPAAPPPSARGAQVAIGSTIYGWLALSTLSTCAVALAGGACWGRFRGGGIIRSAWLITILIALGLWLAAFLVWRNYGTSYPPTHLRMWMGGVVALAAAVGLLLGRSARGMTKLASIALIVAGAGTVVAMFLGDRYDAVEPTYVTATALTIAFALHAGYGLLVLPILRWMR